MMGHQTDHTSFSKSARSFASSSGLSLTAIVVVASQKRGKVLRSQNFRMVVMIRATPPKAKEGGSLAGLPSITLP